MGKEYEGCYLVGKYYRDGGGRLCQVLAQNMDDGKLLIRMDNGSGGWYEYWHEADGSFHKAGCYRLVPGEVAADGTPITAAEAPATPQQPIDPSIQRDRCHESIPLPGHKDFDSFPDLHDWGVTSGTQEQQKPASGWWARG